MSAPTFRRLYRDAGPDPVGFRPADPAVLANVVRAMNAAHAANLCPFVIQLRLAEGQTVTLKPKRPRP